MKNRTKSLVLLASTTGILMFAFQNCGGEGGGAESGGGGAQSLPTCDPVSFTSQNTAALSTAIDSDTITLANCTGTLTISVTGDGAPELFKNGSLVTGPETFSTGDTIRLRLTSSATQNANFRATASIGSLGVVFSVTTGDFTPQAFSIPPATGQPLSTLVTSAQATLTGFNGTLTATATGAGSPVILINGAVVGASAPVVSGNAISVRLTSSPTENTTRQATVTIGGVSAIFDVTTTGDATAPSITSLSAPANGSYKQSTNLDFTANFTESVTVTGSPRIILNIGGAVKPAAYLSGSGSATLIFRYTVEAATNDSDGIVVGSLILNSGSITDTTGNSSDLSFLPLSPAGILVDTTAPSVQSSTGPANGTYTAGQNLDFSLTFNEVVNVTGTPRLTLTIGATTRYADYISGTGTNTLHFRSSVQSADADANGIAVASTIDLNGGTLLDIATNAATLNFTPPNTSAVTVTDIPTAPQSLSATTIGATTITVSWTDDAINEAGFKIERGTDGINFTEIGTVGANVTSHKSVQLTPLTNYYFRVRAHNVAGNSAYSNVATVTTIAVTWTQLASPPSGRAEHVSVYDSANQRMIIFGGFDGNNYLNDVWALSLSGTPTWTQLIPTGTPASPHYASTAIYDSVNQRMIVFGGIWGGTFLNDVWALSLSGTPTWTQLAPSGTLPEARFDHAAIYDSVNQRMIVYGGWKNSGGATDEVWALSLSGAPAWTLLSTAGTPPGGSFRSAMAYDSVNQRVIIFHPQNTLTTHQLTLTGTPTWSQVTTATTPDFRFNHTMVTDSVNQRIIMFAGNGGSNYNQVWALNLSGTANWVLLAPAGTLPAGKERHASIFDVANQRMIFHGGYNTGGSSPASETWQLGL